MHRDVNSSPRIEGNEELLKMKGKRWGRNKGGI